MWPNMHAKQAWRRWNPLMSDTRPNRLSRAGGRAKTGIVHLGLGGFFRAHGAIYIKEAMAKIEELTGVKRSETQIRHFLKGTGMKLRKVGTIPSKADPDKQKEFIKKN